MLQLQSDVGGWCALAAMAACRSAARISSMPLSGVYAAAGSSANRNGTSAAITPWMLIDEGIFTSMLPTAALSELHRSLRHNG
jgi:hypothetical protein